MARAYSPTEILAKKYETIDWDGEWLEAFSNPEASGVWFIWGNSGNGKSSFVMKLVRKLAEKRRVFYNALEEGARMTMQENVKRSDIASVARKVLIGQEDMKDLSARLEKRKSPDVVIIDSIQYTRMTWRQYIEFKKKHEDKLLIFISHAKGTQPRGKIAEDVRYDADLKIWVEGYRAISNGRYNPGGYYTIWEQEALKYHGT